ncbi:MAG TPA: phosphodiester glycosidase family protein [Puia sp.]|nr:phosphodiester glycosidase family protein [Puia sp.]
MITFCSLVTGGARLAAPRADESILGVVVDPQKQDLRFYWKDDSGQLFRSIGHLKDWLGQRHKKLVFAMNGGMFRADNSPVGLFVQRGITVTPMDTAAGEGNFYLQPNGVFYLTRDRKAGICPAKAFRDTGQITYATQSGPMLLIGGAFHPAFRKGSANVNIRNGVGILPDHTLLFALSTEPVNFYDFAAYFKSRGCLDALYLDGFVSRAYLPEKDWTQTDGNFGVIMGVEE